jgi:hypothetical protein
MSGSSIKKIIRQELQKGKTRKEIEEKFSNEGYTDYQAIISLYPDITLIKKYKKYQSILIYLFYYVVIMKILFVKINFYNNWSILFGILSIIVPIMIIYYLKTYESNAFSLAIFFGIWSLNALPSFPYKILDILYVLTILSIIGCSFFLLKKLFPKKTKS